ncbi:hypothetical protein AAMO2058_000013300 [Amorphochlora amoebiformis]
MKGFADFVLPEDHRRDLDFEVIDVHVEDLKLQKGVGIDIHNNPAPKSSETLPPLTRKSRRVLADMVAELRAVISTESFHMVASTSVREALKALESVMQLQFEDSSQAKEGKLKAVLAIVRLTKMCKAILPHPPPSNPNQPQNGSANKPAPVLPREDGVLRAIATVERVRRFCHIIFFPMDGRRTLL